MWHMTCIDCNKGPNKALWQDLSHIACFVWEHSVHIDWELLTTTKVLNRSLSAYLAFMYSVQFFCSVQYLVYDPNSSPNCQKNQNFIHFILCKKEKPKKKNFYCRELCESFKKITPMNLGAITSLLFWILTRVIKFHSSFSFVNI